MRKVSATEWECTACGERVTVPRDKKPLAILLTLSGRSRERVITIDDDVVHRCQLGTDYG